MIADQFERLLSSSSSASGQWAAIAGQGYLDLLVAEEDEGAGLSLEDVYPLGLVLGRSAVDLPVIETIMARALLGRRAPSGMIVLFTADGWSPDVAQQSLVLGRAGETEVSQTLLNCLGAAASCAKMAGAMQAVLNLTAEYSKIRIQFGRPISRFQAVQQQLAVMAEEVAASAMAASSCFKGSPRNLAHAQVGVAKVRCCEAADQVAAIGHAVHGAIGVSAEYELGRHVRLLRKWRDQHGGGSFWAERVGRDLIASELGFVDFARSLAPAR